MLDQNSIIYRAPLRSDGFSDPHVLEQIQSRLELHGYCLLRDFSPDIGQFSWLIRQLCSQVTYDPARLTRDDTVQKVDAGTAAIGPHIENGNTPHVPELVGFFVKLLRVWGRKPHYMTVSKSGIH